ncbi:MAG: SAM-dependent methyltransferase, partial [Lachnospiraceae bacterium]|nr:SAM-dependent methyltransferase [Lachnospiraceae bacterium]
MAGIFYGVGVGPGDPGLLTLKAKQILEEADVIAVPVKKPG